MTTYTENCSHSIAAQPDGLLQTLARAFRQWMRTQQLEFRLAQERQQLSELSEATLMDLGISQADAQAEAKRIDIPESRL